MAKNYKHYNVRRKRRYYKLYRLSSMRDDRCLFRKFAKEAYSVTALARQDYPKCCKWYWEKQIPRVFNGDGEIIICKFENKVAGVTFLKRTENEKKICTLFVVEKYRKMGIGSLLIKEAFRYLGTTEPLIMIADYKVWMFDTMIRMYKWRLTQVMKRGYYNDYSQEFVYNGRITE